MCTTVIRVNVLGMYWALPFGLRCIKKAGRRPAKRSCVLGFRMRTTVIRVNVPGVYWASECAPQ